MNTRDERIAEIKARLAAIRSQSDWVGDRALDYTWSVSERSNEWNGERVIWYDDGDEAATVWDCASLDVDEDALAAFWAAAPRDVEWLLAKLEAAE